MRPDWTILILILVVTGCDDSRRNSVSMVGGNPEKGKDAFLRFGCGACHKVSGLSEASPTVGPPLDQMADRTHLAKVLPNTPENMIKWIQDPPAYSPKTTMPNLHVGDEDARDIASFLYTLR